MIPFLFEANETDFQTQGLGSLADATVCHVTEVLNGQYELYMSYPFNGIHADDLVVRRIILAKPNEIDDPQPFRIYNISPQSQGEKYIINAHHISYDLSGYPVAPFSATGVVPSLTGLVSNSLVANPFEVWTDINNTESMFTVDFPKSFRACLGGTAGSILSTFHGEFKWDKFLVRFSTHRGADNGVQIRYAKNLESFKSERSTESSYTGCMAFWKNNEGELESGTIQYVEDHETFPVERIFMLDASSDFEERPTTEQLNARAVSYINENGLGAPFGDEVEVTFVPLWQTEEYKNIASLERVSLGDYVHILYRNYNVKMEVIEYIYDTLGELYTSIKLGNRKASFGSTIKQIVNDSTDTIVEQATSMMQSALDHASDVLAGGTGGHVVIGRNADGQPNEIYIMDTPDMATAVNVLRMNYRGIAFSTTGINGEYATAWFLDGGGRFVADFITAGEINGNLIKAGSILTSALEVAVQTIMDNIKLNFSFLNDGLHVSSKDGTEIVGAYQTILSDLGMRVIETASGNPTIVAEQDTVTAVNLTADQYLRIRSGNVASRFQTFYSTVHSEEEFGLFWEIV